MSKLETSMAKTGEEEPTSKGLVGGLQAAVGGAVGGVVEFLGLHLTKGAVRVGEVKQTRQEITQIAADVNTVKLAILAGVCLYGFCAAGSLLKNIFQRGNGGGNDRGDAGVQRQHVLVVPTREWDEIDPR